MIRINKIDYSGVDYSNLADWVDNDQMMRDFPFTKGQLDGMSRPVERYASGLDGAVKLIGRKLYWHKRAFSHWLSQQTDHRLIEAKEAVDSENRKETELLKSGSE
jgi:hypothetical protein